MRGVGVEPQKAQAGANQCAAEHDQLTRARDIRDQQVIGKFHVARQVAEDTQRAAYHHGRHDREAIEAVSQVDRVARTYDHKVGEYHKADTQRDAGILEDGQDQGGFHCAWRRDVQEDRCTQAEDRLPEILPAARQATGVFLDDLAVVVNPADGAEQQGHDQHDPHITVAQVSPQQGADGDGRQNQRAAHGRGAGFGQVRLRAVITHRLADLTVLQGADHPRPQAQRQGQRGQHPENPAQGQVLEDREAFVELLQILR